MDMDTPELQTAKGPLEDEVRQFSVFVENKVGRLLDIVKLFSQAQVHVVALSILDTADAAIVRLVGAITRIRYSVTKAKAPCAHGPRLSSRRPSRARSPGRRPA